jgi:hypothetical protein
MIVCKLEVRKGWKWGAGSGKLEENHDLKKETRS